MTIDNETGLPELPEGYFWRVNRESVEIRKSLPDTQWAERNPYDFDLGFYTNEKGRRESRQIDVTRKREKTVRKWIRNTTVTEELVDRVYQHRYVERSDEVVSAQTERNGETTRIPGSHHSAEYRSRYGGYYYSYMGQELVRPAYTEPDTLIEHRHPVTKENILSVCERALEKFNALNLLGDYPPKKLEP